VADLARHPWEVQQVVKGQVMSGPLPDRREKDRQLFLSIEEVLETNRISPISNPLS